MAGDKRVGAQEHRLLAGLIDNKHPGVMTAYANYAATQVRHCSICTFLMRCQTRGRPPFGEGLYPLYLRNVYTAVHGV